MLDLLHDMYVWHLPDMLIWRGAIYTGPPFGDTGHDFLASGDGFLVKNHMGCQASLGFSEMFAVLVSNFLMDFWELAMLLRP